MAKDPDVLYRYRHFEGDHQDWTKQIITNSVLYFASPHSFNDPFDCKIHYKIPPSEIQIEKLCFDFVKANLPPGLNTQQQEQVIKTAMSIRNPDCIKPVNFCAVAEQTLQKDINQLGVLSLSATCKNILLWSHYAASHTGICLKFGASSKTPFFGLAQQVKYKSSYPEIGLLKHSPHEQAQAFLLTKAKDWGYEEEWRIIDHKEGSGQKHFPEELLLEVILGAKITSQNKDNVLGWLSERKYPVQVSQATLSSGSYSLDVSPFDS